MPVDDPGMRLDAKQREMGCAAGHEPGLLNFSSARSGDGYFAAE